jgi:hypothetical protein
MDKKKKPIDVSKYQKGGPIILDEVTVVDSAPSWLRYKREYEENNPKEKFIESYLNPFAKSLGNTKINYPKRLDTEYEKQALDFVAERLLDPAGIGSFKTKTKADRLSLYDRFSDKEREIIKNSKYANRFLPAERENSIRISDATQYKNKDKNVFDYSADDAGLSVEGTPNRFRLAANARTNFEDYINPGIWVGEMAKNLGQSLSPMEEGNYKPAISAIAAPLALGALGFSPVHSLAKGIDKGVANIASKKELYLRGYNEGNVGVNIKPVSKTLSKDEFTKLRDIQSLKSLSMEPEIKRETLVKRYLRSSLDDSELQRLTSKTRVELESELNELTAVKKSSEEIAESAGSYVRPEQVTQELYRRPQLPPLPDYVNVPNLRNGYDFDLDRTYRSIINPDNDLQYYINQHNNNRGIGTKVMQALDMPVVDILPTAPNISNMVYKAGKKHGSRKSELNMDKTLVSLNTTNENPKPLLPTLFKTVSSQKDVMRKINDAFATLKSSEKGLYDASGSLSDSSAPLYYRKASSLSNTPKIDFEFKGFNSLNDFGHLKKSGVENEKILDFINTQIKDLDFNGKKLPAAYLDKFGNIQIPELVIRKFQQGGMTKKPINVSKYQQGGKVNNLLPGDDAYIGDRYVGKMEQFPKNTNEELAFRKMISKMPQKRKEIPILDTTVHIVYDENGNLTNDRWRFNSKLVSKPLPKRDKVNINRIGSVSPITYVGTSSSRETKGPNITEHNVLGDQVFIPVTRSGSYHNGEPVGSDRIIRYETPDGSKSYTKKEYEKLKKGQVKNHQYGGNVKKYQQGGLSPIYVDSPDDPRFIQYQRKLAQEQIKSQLEEGSYYEKNLEKKSELDARIGALNFYIKDLANYNNRENPSIARVNTKTPFTPNSKKEWEYLNSDRPVILRTNNKKTKDNSKKTKDDILDKTIATIKRDNVTPSDSLPTESLPPRSISPVAPSLPTRPGGVIPPPRNIPNPPMAEIPRFTPPKFKPVSNAYNEPVLIPVHKSGPNFSYLSHYETKDGERVSKEEALKFINKYQQGGVTTFDDQIPDIIEVERQSAIDQINSPEYLQRLNNFPEDYGNPQQTVDNRTKRVKDTKVIMGADPDHAGEVDPNSMAYTNPTKKEIRLLKKDANRINSDVRHEFGHAARGFSKLSQGEYDYVSKRVGESTGYGANAALWETDPNEYHTRIFSARGQGQRHGLSRTRFGNTSEEDILRLINSDRKSKYVEEIRGIYNNTKGNTPEEKARNMKEVWNTVAQNNSRRKDKIQVAKYGGNIKKYQDGGPIGNYPDAINDWKEYNNYVPTNDPVVVPFTESAEVPFIQASPYMGALLEGNMNEKNMKRSDVFNPIQGFHGYNYQMGGDVNINTSGYTPGYPSFDNPENTIPLGPSKTITMKNTPFPVLAIPDVGEPVILKPGEVRKFKDATKVREIPMKNNKFQLGGTTPMGAPQQSQNPFDNIPNKFNNQSEDPFVLGSYLPYILGDSRNTLNAGKRPLAPIQTEDGEMITSPLGDMVDVAATKAHKNMESDEITDFSAEGNYILSDDKNMIIKKGKDGGIVNGINLKDVLIGMDAMYYKEGELIKTPKEYTLEDIAPKKSKYTFAELGKNVQRHFPLSTEENDIFAKRAQVENKLSRVPYINSIIELSEIKKQSMNKKGSPANFKQGGYASMAKIYNPALKSLGNTLADGSTNGFYFEPDPQLNPKRDNNFKTPTYQGGGYTYDDRERGQNKREQWNYWVDQTQGHFNDFTQDSQLNNQGMYANNVGGILAQNAYQGDNDYLYGNTYNSKMDNLSNKVDRSFGAEQSYNEGLVGRENSAYRFGLNTGATPNDFAPSRANALREQGSMNNNLNKERRSYMDRYGTMDAQSSDMFAGRRNQQKAYLNDFSNNQVQNLAGAGTGYLQNKIGIQGANLQAQSSLQLMKQAGNGWTDFTNGLGDVINVVAGLAGAITGMGFGGGGGNKSSEQTPQQNATMNGLNPNNWGGSNMFQYNSQLYNAGNPFSGYNSNSQPYQPSWNENRGWGSGGPG